MIAKLTLVVAAYFPDSYGGAERQALILAEALSRQGVDVTLVAPTLWNEAPEVEAAPFGRIERYRVGAYPNAGGRHIGDFIAWTLWFRKRFARRSGPATPIYVFHARLHALGPALAAVASGAPLMIKLGGGGEASDFAALRAKKFFYGDWVQSLLVRRTDCFIANGRQIVDDLRALGVTSDRIAAFPNGVVLPSRQSLDGWLDVRGGDRFIFSGRMVPDKRVELLHQAARSLATLSKPPRLVFLGDGPEDLRLRAVAGTPEEMATATFRGFVSDVYAELADADFFVSASLREGQSNALLEAMSAGVIPIVANASGVTDVVDHGVTGFVVQGTESEHFAEAMRVALDLKPERRRTMALAARRFAEEHIGIDAIAARTLETMKAVSAKRQAR